jgi:LacI family transcriptional regulator
VIAQRAGVHVTTVSLALRNSPSLPVETREWLQKLAREMGYVPDPALTALQAYRRQASVNLPGLAIAYLCFNPTASWTGVGKAHFEVYQGCVRRCKELGYHLELIWVKDPRLSMKRCRDILNTRNPAGLVLSAIHGGRSRYKLDLSGFAAVRVDQGLVQPRLHTVGSNQFQNIKLAVRKAYRLGYRRVGLALMNPFNESVNGFWSGGFWSEQSKRRREDWVQPFLPPNWEPEPFFEWMERERPEVVVTNHADNKIPTWIRSRGLRIPEDVGYIQIGSTDVPTNYAGVDEDNTAVGRTIIDKLVAIIHRNERGVPSGPELTLIEGCWRDGDSVRDLRGARAKKTAES